MKVFEEFIKYEFPIFYEIGDELYTFCSQTECKYCKTRLLCDKSLCDKLMGNKQPAINKNQVKIIKEKYPEYFI